MHFFIYDTATGAINGTMELPDGSAAPMPNAIECTAEQVGAIYSYRVDLTAAPAIVEIDPATVLANLKASLSSDIDLKVAAIYATWTRFQQEYLMREQAAQAFKDAGYQGDPGPWVSAFATSAGKTNQQAADLILVQATNLNAALVALGSLRMRKYEVIGAADVATAQAAHDDIALRIITTAAAIQ
jgi:hypothetical protein